MSILIADSAYPSVMDLAQGHSWREATAAIHTAGFGTWTSMAHALNEAGHAAESYVIGLDPDYGDPFTEDWSAIVIENIGRFTPAELSQIKQRTGAFLIGSFSHAAPSMGHLAQFDLLTTAFPHFARDFAAQGLPIRYLPLAFDPRRLERPEPSRDLPLTFVGSLGHRKHWAAGQNAIAAVAEAFPEFQWWGERGPDIEPYTPLDAAYMGPAYGHEYFDLLRRSRITLHRHGEVHFDRGGERGSNPPFVWACSMRLFEATGCGALLLTERARNLGVETDGFGSLFEPSAEVLTWGNPRELVAQVELALQAPAYVDAVALAGQARTLAEHTYADRADTLSAWLEEAGVA